MRLIDADALIERLRKDPLFDFVEQYGITGVIEAAPTITGVIEAAPAIDVMQNAKLRGYDLKTLMYIATVMQKKGVTAEEAVAIFRDMSAFVSIFLAEQKEIFEKALCEMPLHDAVNVTYTAERSEE